MSDGLSAYQTKPPADLKMPIVVWTSSFDENVGGVIVLHVLAHHLCSLGYEVYLSKTPRQLLPRSGIMRWLALVRLRAKQSNKNRLAKKRGRPLPKFSVFGQAEVVCHPSMPIPTLPDLGGRPFVAVYPEVVDGNPASAPFVARWLLHRAGFHKKGVRFTDNEIVFFYQPAFLEQDSDVPEDHFLQLHWMRHDIYQNEGRADRDGACRMVRKGSATFDPKVDVAGAENMLDGKSHVEIAAIFNRCDVFFCHDPYTLYVYYAALCGCTPIVVPQPGLSAEEWRAGYEFKQGVAYGVEERGWAEATRDGLIAEVAAKQKAEIEAVKRFAVKLAEYVDAGR